MNLIEAISNFSVASSVAAAAVSLLQAAIVYQRTQRSLAAIRDEIRQRALASDDLAVLGGYLYEDIGNVTLADYVRNSKLQARVDDALGKARDFIGRAPIEEAEAGDIRGEDVPNLSDELRKAREEILVGNVWNGLARMRRMLEMTFRDTFGPPDRPLRSWIHLAQERGVLRADLAGELLQAVRIANAAVHGQEVDLDKAMAAVYVAQESLDWIKRRDVEDTI